MDNKEMKDRYSEIARHFKECQKKATYPVDLENFIEFYVDPDNPRDYPGEINTASITFDDIMDCARDWDHGRIAMLLFSHGYDSVAVQMLMLGDMSFGGYDYLITRLKSHPEDCQYRKHFLAAFDIICPILYPNEQDLPINDRP